MLAVTARFKGKTMAKHFRIKKGEETQIVQSLDGYDGWQVLDECDRVPTDAEEWDENAKRWKVDPAKQKALKRRAIANNPLDILKRIEAIEAHLGINQPE